MSAPVLREVLPRIAFLRPLVEGARVLEIGGLERTAGRSAEWFAQVGARAVVSVGEDAAAVSAARAAVASAKIRFVCGTWEDFGPASFDLVWVHDLSRPLQPASLASRAGAGHVVLAVPAEQVGGEAGYRALVAELAAAFPSVEVATQRPLQGSVLSFGGRGVPLLADPSFEPPPAASAYLFVCGQRPCGVSGQWVVPLPPEGGHDEKLSRALAESERERARLEEELAAAKATIEALRAELSQGERWPDWDAEARRVESLERRLRELREREEMALRRALDAEERVRELERRSESWQSSRAEMMATLRLQRFRAERAQRDAEGVLDAVAQRDRLVEEWRRRALEAERRVADLEGHRPKRGS
jgi:hypothetical protein